MLPKLPSASSDRVDEVRAPWWKKTRLSRVFLAYCLGVAIAFVLLFVAQMSTKRIGQSDFVALYTGGELLRLGNGHSLYDLALQAEIQMRLLSPYGWIFAGGILAYFYPPFVALLFAPLTHLSLHNAFYAWVVANVTLLLVCTVLLFKQITNTLHLRFLTIGLVVFAFLPVFETLLKGQTSILVLLLLSLTYVALKRSRDYLAGATLGLALIKPPYVVMILLLLIWYRRWRALAGFATAAIGLAVIAWLLVGSDGLQGYLLLTQQITAQESFPGIYPEAMPNIRGTLDRLSLLIQAWSGSSFSATFQSLAWMTFSIMLVLALLRTWRGRWDVASPLFDLRFATLLVVTLLVNPHLYHHDLVLLVLVAFALLEYGNASGESKASNKLLSLMHVAALILLPMGMIVRSQALAVLLFASVVILLLQHKRIAYAKQDIVYPDP